MKTLILSLAAFLLTVTSYGQTLKWTHAIAQPPFNVDFADLYSMRHDALGNFGFAVRYSAGAGQAGNAGAQFTWIAANGKTIFTITHVGAENVYDPHVMAVSATTFLVTYTNSAFTSWTLRKYTKRGSVISHRDIVLGAHEYPARLSAGVSEVGHDAVGHTDATFFVRNSSRRQHSTHDQTLHG